MPYPSLEVLQGPLRGVELANRAEQFIPKDHRKKRPVRLTRRPNKMRSKDLSRIFKMYFQTKALFLSNCLQFGRVGNSTSIHLMSGPEGNS